MCNIFENGPILSGSILCTEPLLLVQLNAHKFAEEKVSTVRTPPQSELSSEHHTHATKPRPTTALILPPSTSHVC